MKKARNGFINTLSYLCLVGVIVLGLMTIIATGGGGGGGSTPSSDSEFINDTLAAYPAWEEFANVQEEEEGSVGDMTAEIYDGVLCSTKPYSITKNPEEIVTFGTAPDVLFLGSLIQGDSYLGGLGSMEELPVRQRAPLTIAIKVLTGTDITRVVENPDAASVQQALGEIVAEAERSGYETGGSAYYLRREAYSSEQMALSLGLSYRCMGSAAKTSLEYETSKTQNTVTAYFKQVMFEAYVVRPQTPAEFFSAEFTQEHFDEQVNLGNIGPDNIPVYVSRIQYGRILMYSMTATASMDKLKLAAQYAYDGWSDVEAELASELQNIIQDSEIKVVAIGGGDTALRQFLISGNIADYFEQDVSLTAAEPIAYSVSNLADGSLALVSETTEYDAWTCGVPEAELYDTVTEWALAVADKAGDDVITKFPTTAENLLLSNEVITLPSANEQMGQTLTWDPSKTGFPFKFQLDGIDGGDGSLVYMDEEGSQPAFGAMDQDRSISIGDVDNYENDDFYINIPEWNANSAVIAIGFEVGDNAWDKYETIEVTGTGDFEKAWPGEAPDCVGTTKFVGIVSTVPLTSVFFNERNDGDDIFIRDFYFAVIQWTD